MILRLAYLKQREHKLKRGLEVIEYAEDLTGKKQEGEELVRKELKDVQDQIALILKENHLG